MTTELWIAIGANVTSLLVAAGGWVFAWRLQREKTKRERRDKLLERALKEVRARIALEEAALDYIVDTLGAEKRQAVKVALRDTVEKQTGDRPAMSRVEVKRFIEQNVL